MGQSLSPQVAILYMYFTLDRKILANPNFLFYRRYIDDIFAIVVDPADASDL